MPQRSDLPPYAVERSAAEAERLAWEQRLHDALVTAFREVEAEEYNSLVAALSIPGWRRAVEKAANALHIPDFVLNALHLKPGNGTPEEEADRLAATLATQAYNVHVLELLMGAGIPTKEWLSKRDDAVRLTHRVADGQVVPVGTPFLVGGYPMMYPADSSMAPIALWINCRCVAVAGPEE